MLTQHNQSRKGSLHFWWKFSQLEHFDNWHGIWNAYDLRLAYNMEDDTTDSPRWTLSKTWSLLFRRRTITKLFTLRYFVAELRIAAPIFHSHSIGEFLILQMTSDLAFLCWENYNMQTKSRVIILSTMQVVISWCIHIIGCLGSPS